MIDSNYAGFYGDRYLQSFSVRFEYPVCFTRGVFDPKNPLLAEILRKGGTERLRRALVFVDRGVAEPRPGFSDTIRFYLDRLSSFIVLAREPEIVPGGEEVKRGWEVVEKVMRTIGDEHLCRQSFVIAVGGGSVLDMVGFAASIVHRGLRMVRIPTTVLAQNDAGVGVKNGMNEHGMKNFVGTFSPPFAVLNDFDFLRTLDQKHWVGGIAEAFKVAIIKDRDFFSFLTEKAQALRERDEAAMEEVIKWCAFLHLEHIRTSGDPFEFGSARPLDFGHWASHRLEVLSDYRLGHGQGVAVGIALDSVYAGELGLVSKEEVDAIVDGLRNAGLPVWNDLLLERDAVGRLSVLKGLEDFREHLGGVLTVTLPKGIGQRLEVHAMDPVLVERAVMLLRERAGK